MEVELARWCAEIGVEVPPVPAKFAGALRRVEPHTFSTRPVTWSPWDVEGWASEAEREDLTDYLVIGHAGHGVNSFALSYFLVQKHLRVFIHVGLGGVYMNAQRSRLAVNEAFSGARRLVDAAARSPSRMIVVATEFYGSRWRTTGQGWLEAATVSECLSHATGWLEERR